MFAFDVFCRICWLFDPAHAMLLSILRKLVENYFRLESQSAQRKNEDVVRAIIEMTEIENICV